MTFGIGFIAALVAIKRKNTHTRLKTLQLKLQKKQPKQTKIVQYPVKKILSILIVIMLGVALEWICLQFQKQLKEHLIQQQYTSIVNSKQQALFKKEIDVSCSVQLGEEVDRELRRQIERPRMVLGWLHLCFLWVVGALLLTLDLKVVSAKKGIKNVKVSTYSILGLSLERKQYEVEPNDHLSIVQCGQSRFTNTNYYFSVQLVNKTGKSQHLISKACIFDARTTVIQLAYQLEVPYSTKVRKCQ